MLRTLVLCLVATVAWATATPDASAIWQRAVDAETWTWPERAPLVLGGYGGSDHYALQVTAPAGGGMLRFQLSQAQGEQERVAAEWEDHPRAEFAVVGDRLYRLLWSPGSIGCRMLAVDLADGKERWRVTLRGRDQLVPHSGWSNRVMLTLRDGVAWITGEDGGVKYLEVVDLGTGRTLAHRRTPALPPPLPLPKGP